MFAGSETFNTEKETLSQEVISHLLSDVVRMWVHGILFLPSSLREPSASIR